MHSIQITHIATHFLVFIVLLFNNSALSASSRHQPPSIHPCIRSETDTAYYPNYAPPKGWWQTCMHGAHSLRSLLFAWLTQRSVIFPAQCAMECATVSTIPSTTNPTLWQRLSRRMDDTNKKRADFYPLPEIKCQLGNTGTKHCTYVKVQFSARWTKRIEQIEPFVKFESGLIVTKGHDFSNIIIRDLYYNVKSLVLRTRCLDGSDYFQPNWFLCVTEVTRSCWKLISSWQFNVFI